MAEKRMKQNENGDVGKLIGLPVELRFHILTLLPVETLIILRAVCKSFLSIIDDWSFVTSHLRRFPGNLRQSRFLTVDRISYSRVYQFSDLSPPNSTGKMVYEYPPQQHMSPNWSLNASLDGVLLFVLRGTVDGRIGYVAAELLNPSIKKRRRLCLPNSELVQVVRQFGLGYDPSSSDYKVVATTSDQAWIYSVKAWCWTQINCSGGIVGGGLQTVCSDTMAYNGGVAWVEFSTSVNNRHRLVRFDFATGRFRYAEEMPYDESGWFRFLLDGGSSLCAWREDVLENGAAWVSETGTLASARRYKIGPGGMVVTNRYYRVDETSKSKSIKDGELGLSKYNCWGRGFVAVFLHDGEMRSGINTAHVSMITEFQHESLGVYRESLVLLH